MAYDPNSANVPAHLRFALGCPTVELDTGRQGVVVEVNSYGMYLLRDQYDNTYERHHSHLAMAS